MKNIYAKAELGCVLLLAKVTRLHWPSFAVAGAAWLR